MINKLYVINQEENLYNTFILSKDSDINEIKLLSRDDSIKEVLNRISNNVNISVFESNNKTVINIKVYDS